MRLRGKTTWGLGGDRFGKGKDTQGEESGPTKEGSHFPGSLCQKEEKKNHMKIPATGKTCIRGERPSPHRGMPKIPNQFAKRVLFYLQGVRAGCADRGGVVWDICMQKCFSIVDRNPQGEAGEEKLLLGEGGPFFLGKKRKGRSVSWEERTFFLVKVFFLRGGKESVNSRSNLIWLLYIVEGGERQKEVLNLRKDALQGRLRKQRGEGYQKGAKGCLPVKH